MGVLEEPQLQQGQSDQGAHDYVQAASEDLQGENSTVSGQTVPVLGYPHSTEVLPNGQTQPLLLQFDPIAYCLDTGHYWKEPGFVFSIPLTIY